MGSKISWRKGYAASWSRRERIDYDTGGEVRYVLERLWVVLNRSNLNFENNAWELQNGMKQELSSFDESIEPGKRSIVYSPCWRLQLWRWCIRKREILLFNRWMRGPWSCTTLQRKPMRFWSTLWSLCSWFTIFRSRGHWGQWRKPGKIDLREHKLWCATYRMMFVGLLSFQN